MKIEMELCYIYIYDLEGDLLGLTLNNNIYYYHKNILGDIVGIIDTNYNEIVTYEYDSWGNITKMVDNSNVNLGTMNPFRYRSYYYDNETDLYYLNSRYYSPKLGRFLTADENVGAKEKVLSYNNYQYAFNNPITLVDEDGDWPKLPKLSRIVKKVVKVAAVATCIGVAAVAAATLTGPAGVVAGAAFIGASAGAVIGGVAGGVNASKKGENVVDGVLSGAAIESFAGGVTGAVVSSIGIKTGVVKVVGDAQATGTALHRFASNVSAGSMSLNPIKYKEIYLDKPLSAAGLVGTKRPDVIGKARFGKNKLVEVVSKSQTAKQMTKKLNEIIAAGNPNCKKQVIDIARKISKLFKWK
ncbi:MAG: RHS repeat domain-containing protein [Candidatus Coprovivens sp.]